MYNSSDIFCLKKPKFGENDGTLMFSIKGTSSSKMCTSHNVSNDVFYGNDPPMNESALETSMLKQDETEIGLEAADLNTENEKEWDEDHEDESVSSSNMSHDIGDEVAPPGPLALTENEPSNRNEYAVGHEASAGGEPGVSSSNMARNPVTGVGMEDEIVTSRKHYKGRPDHKLW